jgi:hypothetical protein
LVYGQIVRSRALLKVYRASPIVFAAVTGPVSPTNCAKEHFAAESSLTCLVTSIPR